MNERQLAALVAQGESERMEFKASTGSLRNAMQTVCALGNGSGGHVLFGVKDGGQIVGQNATTGTLEAIANELRRIEPPLMVDVACVPLENGQQAIVLDVPGGGGSRPHAYDGRCYWRLGPTTSVMPEHQRDQLISERLHGTRRWENEPAPRWVTIDLLDVGEMLATVDAALRLGRLHREPEWEPEAIMRGLGLIVDDRLINAAVALYGEDRRLYPFYTQLEVRVARFRGTDKLAPFADNRAQWGHAFDQLRFAERFLFDSVPIAGTVHPDRFIREDRPRYAPRATREAIANAICHRDYSSGGGAVSVALYDDHLEIGNPGGLRFGITPEKLRGPHESKPWNPIIAHVFYLAGVIERWGAGTLSIIDWSREIHAPAPTWHDRGDSVLVSFQPASVIGEEQESQPETRQESQLESLPDRVLEMLADGPLRRSDIAARLGQKRPSGLLQITMRDLLQGGDIEFLFPDKPTSSIQQYRITEKGRARLTSAQESIEP